MKKGLLATITILILISAALVSCNDDTLSELFNFSGDDQYAQLYEVTVTIEYPSNAGTDKSGVEVTASASQGGLYTATTNSNGVATFNLEIGIYSFSASSSDNGFAYNALLESQQVTDNASFNMTFSVAALSGGLVFKEIYFTGSSTNEGGTYFADQFHEIYNNSDDTIYLDGLCIGLLEQSATQENIWDDESVTDSYDRLPLTFYTWYIPGAGTDYPLAPRTSIVIAQDGINHQTDPSGNPNSPVNLGDADWETYCGDINDGKDADAAGVPNLRLLYTNTITLYDFLHPVFGAAVIIFRLPEGTDYTTWPTDDPANLATKPESTSTKLYLQVPVEYVIDAVEIVRMDESKRNKRLPTDLDAGKIWCSDSYIGKSVRRKVKQIINGKAVYQDTNNSTNDFVFNTEGNNSYDMQPTPFENPTEVDE